MGSLIVLVIHKQGMMKFRQDFNLMNVFVLQHLRQFQRKLLVQNNMPIFYLKPLRVKEKIRHLSFEIFWQLWSAMKGCFILLPSNDCLKKRLEILIETPQNLLTDPGF